MVGIHAESRTTTSIVAGPNTPGETWVPALENFTGRAELLRSEAPATTSNQEITGPMTRARRRRMASQGRKNQEPKAGRESQEGEGVAEPTLTPDRGPDPSRPTGSSVQGSILDTGIT